MKKSVQVTVAILTFNGQEYLDQVLKAVTTQKTKYEYEVLVIDSGSKDKTLDIVAKYKDVILHQIPNTEFGHGKTRNLAVKLANGDFVIFITQDAVPSHKRWLDYMVEPFFLSDKVVCVCGKQIPRADCFVTTKREVHTVFKSFGPDDAVSLQRKSKVDAGLTVGNTFLSDSNSAVRKSIVSTEIPFRDVNYAEDQCMGIDTLNAGYLKAYAPLGSVLHSHDYKLRKYFKRKFDEAVGLRESTGLVPMAGRRELVLGSMKATVSDWVFAARDKDYSFGRKLHDMFWSPFYNVANRIAIRQASSKNLTEEKRQKLSLESKARKDS